MPKAGLELANLTRSCNELLILLTVGEGTVHGYQIALEIAERSGGYFTFNHGTLYPILHQLEREGLIGGRWDQDSGRRKRKSYRMTEKGKRHLQRQLKGWREFSDRLFAMVGGGAGGGGAP